MAYVHAGRITAQALKNEGVSHLFTLCGGHIQSIYDGCLDLGIRVVDFRHEQAAAHAAEGWARATGEVGVAAVTAGPGVTDAVTAVANAQRSGVPMVLIGGQGPRALSEMGSLQEMDHVSLMRSVCKWSVSVPEARRIPDYLTTAFRKARTGVPGPVFLEMPLDILMDYLDEDTIEYPTDYLSCAGTAGDPDYVVRAATLLAAAERPVAIVGSQLWWSVRKDSFADWRSTFQVPTFVNGMARGSLSRQDPYGFKLCRSKALAQADVVVVFGTPLDFRIGYGRAPKVPEDARFIQVDLDPQELGRNRPCEVGIVGDTGLVMEAMQAALIEQGLTPKSRQPWLDQLGELEHEMRARIDAEAVSDESPVNPLRLCSELAAVLDERAVVVGDGGDIVGTGAKILDVGAMGQWMDPGPLGTLGVGPSFAMAAKLADPSRDVVILYGDGSFGLNGMEFEACARQNIGVVGVIGNDAAWMQILRGQRSLYGEQRMVATELHFTRYERMVEALGGRGFWVEEPAALPKVLKEALACGRQGIPALVNVKIGQSAFRKDALSV
ncbi:MAG: acetolactate synthase [Rickettsiales bacterium]|nr:acetolactate synthase [Rickettsiales bacterium]|tara:strand:- start:88 stop:1746 length:1659 start_codon:yes stop_codon:yes gene_type:complete